MSPLFDIDALVVEITQYLAAVDVFRSEGYPPTWRPVAPKHRPRRRRPPRIHA